MPRPIPTHDATGVASYPRRDGRWQSAAVQIPDQLLLERIGHNCASRLLLLRPAHRPRAQHVSGRHQHTQPGARWRRAALHECPGVDRTVLAAPGVSQLTGPSGASASRR